MAPLRSSSIALLLLAASCSPSTPPAAPVEPAPAATESATVAAGPLAAPNDARGARLYDNWVAEKQLKDTFVVDSAKTPEVDGKGGPNGNGTLDDETGTPLPNTGHDYRLKNLFGWDLRGAAGVYGAEYQKKAYVLGVDLLADQRTPAELREWLKHGGGGVPAYGAVLDDRDLDDLVAFLDRTRSGALAGPVPIFTLSKSAPKGFVLNPGGDSARGKERFAATCAGCHGADGRKFPMDETESVGSLSRSSGYEIWFKILHGQPGTEMGRQIPEAGPAEQAAAILDLFAALCDRAAFPGLAGSEDVKDSDERCGAYLR